MKTEKATKALCVRLTREIGHGFRIDDENTVMRFYHRTAKIGNLCFATMVEDPVETAHALAAIIAAHNGAGKRMTKESIEESARCFFMGVSHYVYGDPSMSAEDVLNRDSESGRNGGHVYFGYAIPTEMKVIILDRCRRAIAAVQRGTSTDFEGCVYNSCTFSDEVEV